MTPWSSQRLRAVATGRACGSSSYSLKIASVPCTNCCASLNAMTCRIMALSILDSADCAVARVIVNHYERAHELLTFANFTMFETDVIGVLLPDADQPHTAVLGSLMSAELNVQYVYPLMYRKNGRGAVAIFVSETDSALRVLKERQYELITEDDLMNYDEMF